MKRRKRRAPPLRLHPASPSLLTPGTAASPIAFIRVHSWLLIFPAFAVLPGCRSAPPPPTVALAVSMAERAEAQAAKLSDQQQNWPAAARAWQLAADRYSLLNNVAGEAAALHNLAQAERQLDQSTNAHTHLEQAVRLNEHAGHTNDWWRNQIALLQVEAEAAQTASLRARFAKLNPLAPGILDRDIRGLFFNELALSQKTQGELADAGKNLEKAEADFKAAGDYLGLAAIAANRGELAEAQQDLPSAIASWRTALVRFEALADPPGIARALAGQGRALCAANQDLPTAETLLRRAMHNFDLLQQPRQAQAVGEILARCLAAHPRQSSNPATR